MALKKPDGQKAASFNDYIAIARLDHVTKHIFIIPGIIFAYLLRKPDFADWDHILLGFVTAICVASANYVINEYLDRDFDRHHPVKMSRTSVQIRMNGNLVLLEWGMLIAVGLFCAYVAGRSMFLAASLFCLQGVIYNVPFLRTKDHAYLDVISESINNPIRLMIGWAMIDVQSMPPSSILLSYWFGGAFLMAAKRYSEYREICSSHGKEILVRYRASFREYTDTSLNVSCLIYAILSAVFLTVFLMKYRLEYMVLIPVVSALFGYYLVIALRPRSSAQNPENLYREKGLLILLALLIILFVITSLIDIPQIEQLASQRFIILE